MAPRKRKRKRKLSKRPKRALRPARKTRPAAVAPASGRDNRQSAAGVGPAFEKLVAVMARLRAPNGCPWDREQTHATLRTFLIEEAYEVLDALDSTDDAKFAEELGDLLLQVLFHAQIAREEGRFAIQDVIREIYEKMIRRHPHVFGAARAKTAADVLRNWEQIKLRERAAKSSRGTIYRAPGESASPEPLPSESLLDGVPRALPALLEAFQLTRKAARIGFDWDDIEGIFSKLTEETNELRHALADGSGGRSFSSDSKPSLQKGASAPEALVSASIESELGDILFVAVNLARFLGIDPEIALKKTNAKFSRRFREMERIAREQGATLAQVPRPQMESLWEQAKLREQSPLLPDCPK